MNHTITEDIKPANIRDYSSLAPIYDKIFLCPLSEGHLVLGAKLKELMAGKKKKILEIGVGTGLTMDHLPVHTDFHGIDVSDEMLDVARERARAQGKKVRLKQMDAEALDYGDNSFDFVLAPSVITAVDSPVDCIQEMVRVTKKGGYMVIIANLRDDSFLSRAVKLLNPITKKLLGYRTDLDWELFSRFPEMTLIEKRKVNKLFGFTLSWFLVFRKN